MESTTPTDQVARSIYLDGAILDDQAAVYAFLAQRMGWAQPSSSLDELADRLGALEQPVDIVMDFSAVYDDDMIHWFGHLADTMAKAAQDNDCLHVSLIGYVDDGEEYDEDE